MSLAVTDKSIDRSIDRPIAADCTTITEISLRKPKVLVSQTLQHQSGKA